MNEQTNICPDCNSGEVIHLSGDRWKCQHPLCGHILKQTDDGFKPYLDWTKAGQHRKVFRGRRRSKSVRRSSRSTRSNSATNMTQRSRKSQAGVRGDSGNDFRN